MDSESPTFEEQLSPATSATSKDSIFDLFEDEESPETKARVEAAVAYGSCFIEHLHLGLASREQVEWTGDLEPIKAEDAQLAAPAPAPVPAPVIEDHSEEVKPKKTLRSLIGSIQRPAMPTRKLQKKGRPTRRDTASVTPSSPDAQTSTFRPLSPLHSRPVLRPRSSTIATPSTSQGGQKRTTPAASTSSLDSGVRDSKNKNRLSLNIGGSQNRRLSIFGRSKPVDHRFSSVDSIHSEDGDDEHALFMSPVTSRGSDREQSRYAPGPPAEDTTPREQRQSSLPIPLASNASEGHSQQAARSRPYSNFVTKDSSELGQSDRRHRSVESFSPSPATFSFDESRRSYYARRKFSSGNWSTDSASSRRSWVPPEVNMHRLSLLSDDMSSPVLPGGPAVDHHPTAPVFSPQASGLATTPSLATPSTSQSAGLRRDFSSSEASEAESSDFPGAGSNSEIDEWHEASEEAGESALMRKESTRTATYDNVKEAARIVDRPLASQQRI